MHFIRPICCCYAIWHHLFQNLLCKGTGSSETFLFHIFGWSIFHNPFLYLHLSTHPISYALDLFKLYTNTSNYLDILFNSSFWYFLALLQCFIVFQSLLVLSIHLLIHFSMLWWQRSSRKEVMLRYNKNYATLVFNCILKNSKGMILASGINRRCRNNNIEND